MPDPQKWQASQKSQDALGVFSIHHSSLWRSALVADWGEGVRRMTIKQVPSVQAASMIYKGH
jgi:hypothetical protein